MINYVLESISIQDAQPGMIVGKDIITSSGFTLITKHTLLNKKHLFHLKMHQIQTISILKKLPEKRPNKQLVTQKKTFQIFREQYDKSTNQLNDCMHDIGCGKNADVNSLFALCQDVKKCFDTKSDVFSFLHHLKSSHHCTYTHCMNVSLLCNLLGEWLHLNDLQKKDLTIAGLLHDVGKIQIDSSILNKKEPLTNLEFEEIKKHPVYGFRLLEKQPIPKAIKMAVLMHHERFDGSGYPLGAKNDEIPDYAKIIAIVDIYDAMTSNRAYRSKFSPFEVIHYLEQTGYGKLDTKFLYTFLRNIATYYVGSWCLLSTGEEGKIVFINKACPSKPIIQVDNSLIDLVQETQISIEEIL